MKQKKPLLFLLLAFLFLFICWRHLGWFCGEEKMLAFVMDRYTIGGQDIVAGEYIKTEGSGLSVRKHFRVTTEDGSSHRLEVFGRLRRNFNIIGPHTRILRVALSDGTLLPS